jgi:hypothetical protein
MTLFVAGQVLTAAQLNSQLNDTGWITLTSAGTGTARYRVVNNVVYVEVLVAITIANGASTTIVTAANGLPAAYRPGIGALNMCIAYLSGPTSVPPAGVVNAGGDGSISVTNRTGTTATGMQCRYSYPVG